VVRTVCPPCALLFFPLPAPPVLSPLSLHDALPIFLVRPRVAALLLLGLCGIFPALRLTFRCVAFGFLCLCGTGRLAGSRHVAPRSEEHTSELQSRFDLVCRLLLEKKKTRQLNHMSW